MLQVLVSNLKLFLKEDSPLKLMVAQIIEDAGITTIVITDYDLLTECSLDDFNSIHINDALVASQEKPSVLIGIDTCMYIMYTSGTTGRPKGIAVSNRNVIKLVYDAGEIAIKPGDRVLQWSNYSFDGSTYDIYSSLLTGASLYLIKDEWASDVDELSAMIVEHNISVLFITTALFNTFIDVNPAIFTGLRKLLFGGENVSLSHVKRALEMTGPGKIVHVYGPTETTVYATSYAIDHISTDGVIPIGRPLSNTKLLVLNEKSELVPLGVPGELYIGGDGVSLGYINNPELTAEKFVPNPFTHNGDRFYRSGDLVRWLPGGVVEYIGRIDNQVKVRGYRIELGEIESVLIQSGLVKQAVVTANQDAHGTRRLVGYIVTEEFLQYSYHNGNDLVTPMPEWNFPGLVPGDRWCLCASRWVEAWKSGVAPLVVLEATHEKTLDLIPLDELIKFAFKSGETHGRGDKLMDV